MTIDYTARAGCEVRPEASGSRAFFGGNSVVFPGLAPDVLRVKLNLAMANAVAHYARKVAASGVTIEPGPIEQVAMKVVLNTLYVYNLWRNQYPERRDQPLVVGEEELDHPQANDECLHYCEREYGAEYIKYAAALTGMTPDEFAAYEERRRAFWDR